jgi:nucleoid-associated protein YgaU
MALLVVVLLGLVGGLIWLVPRLEEASASVGDDVVLASGPTVPPLRSGLVDFELTEDVEYIVSEGETLSEIARRFEIGYQELADYNALTDPNTIVAGQVIVVPGTSLR